MTDIERHAVTRLVDAAKHVSRLRRELAEAERLQAVAVEKLDRVMKKAQRKVERVTT